MTAPMTRLEAFEAARAQVIELCKPPVKANGYPVDGWRQPTTTELIAMTLKVAQFILGEDNDDDFG